MNNFAELGILPPFIEKLAEKNIAQPTAVQRLAIPPLLEGKSVIFRSATGTGKTFAYLLPTLQRLTQDAASPTPAPKANAPELVICAPTVELCSQIKSEADFLLETCEASPHVSLLVGSMNINRQIDSLKKSKPLAVVGNPGRLLLLAKMGKLKFRAMRFFIMDEADRLTASDSREEMAALMQFIAAQTKSRDVGTDGGDAGGIADSDHLTVAACSATVTAKTREYLLPLAGDAALLETDEQEILRERIEHWAIFSEGRRKTQTLLSFLAAANPKKVLIFTGRSHDAGKIVAALQKRSLSDAAGLYSNMDKQDRKRAIDRFRSGKDAALVSSDLAARGLDIPGITHIVALDVSDDKDAYIHRAGRTGRAGKRGIMVSIGDEVEMRRLAALEKKLGITVYPKELFQGRVCSP